MSVAAAPGGAGPPVDWDEWAEALRRFGAATELCTSAFDADGRRRVEPSTPSRVGRLLAAAGAWRDGGAAARIEAELARRVVDGGEPLQQPVFDELQLLGLPLRHGQQLCGSIVYGWSLPTFGTARGCERAARGLGVDGARLWAEARLQPPVPAARMAVYSELLGTLAASSARHAEALEQLQRLDRLREVFLAGVSHELRTPLSVIATRLEVLLRGELDDPAAIRAALLKIRQHAADEARLVEDLIEASRTRTGQLSVVRRAASLARVLQAAVAAVQPHAEARQIRLKVPAWHDAEPLPMRADASRLQQVFWNLLSNAVKFAPVGGSVTLQVRSDAAAHEVAVADSGRGIEPALLAHVFEPFTRQAHSNDQGLGLGLSIARHIVELHGGSIRATSAGIGAGATFEVRLPRDDAGADPDPAG